MKLGLCISGGGAKGSYESGVIKALYDRGINKFDSISGTSIGAIIGYFIIGKQSNNYWLTQAIGIIIAITFIITFFYTFLFV